MQIIQYSYTIPVEKQKDFIKFTKEVLRPTWKKYGCIKHELEKVSEAIKHNKQIAEKDTFIERLYFEKDNDIEKFYEQTLKYELDKTKSYVEVFEAENIQLRILDLI